MLGDFIAFIDKNKLATESGRILLAVSGGLDSVVMTDLFHRAGFQYGIAHANFHLRGTESDRDEQFVRKLAHRYNVEIFVNQFDTLSYSRREKVSVQVAARDLRYAWFDEVMLEHGFDCIATAHHLDDQVETFIINLARGTGIAGLHGIPAKQGKVIRPLLYTGRNEIEAYAVEKMLEFVEDSSNRSDKYTRNRIRHKIVPQLEKINPSFRKAITETIGQIRDAEAIFRKAIEEKRYSIFEIKGEVISISLKEFFCLKPLETWAYELLSPYGFNQSNVKDIISLAGAIPGKEVVSCTHRLVRDRDYLIIVPLKSVPPKREYFLNASDLQHRISEPLNLSFEILHEAPVKFDDPETTAYIAFVKLAFPLRLRKWSKGDFFYPLGMSKSKKLSDFFIDEKFSKIDKDTQWLLCSGNDIVWIIGSRIDDRFKIWRDCGKILKITYSSAN